MPGSPQVSAPLQALIDKGLFERLPVTFSTFFFDQIKDWTLLFPAEQHYYERLFTLLDRAPAAETDALFAPVRAAEQAMGVTEKSWPRRQFTLEQVDFLNRSPQYPTWRKAIANVFAQIDPVLNADVMRQGRARLVVIGGPADLPVGPDRMWTRLAGKGQRVPLAVPSDTADYWPLLLTGEPRARRAATFADLASQPYRSWAIDAGEAMSSLTHSPGVVRMSYLHLADYRKRLMGEVQKIVDSQQAAGPRQLSAKLKLLKPNPGEGELAQQPLLAEFTRAVLLSGNGTLIVNNTFVEWAATQAIRRARPDVLLVGFGIRNKVKPFSSLLIYADQEEASPVPTQADMLGSYVDLEVFYQYLWQECGKYAEYRGNTAYLFVGEGMDELFVIAPKDFPVKLASSPIALATVHHQTKEWLGL